MHVERDIAGVTTPFIIGVTAAVCSGSMITGHIIPIAVISLLSSIIFPLSLISGIGNTVPKQYMISWTMLSCGIFIGASGLLLETSRADFPGLMNRIALSFGERLQTGIMQIPFRNPETNDIINALVTGEKAGISPDVKEAFRASGASHILALSGLHLGIIYFLIRKSLGIMGNTPAAKFTRSAATMILCSFYTLATGAGPSITRALLFVIISEAANLTHRKTSLKSTFMTAMFIQLIIEPAAIKEVGFQLSYAAVGGIAWIYPYLKGFWPGNPKEDKGITKGLRWIWNSAALSISCQVATGPLAYIYFHSFPSHFILTNLIAIPLTSILIPVSLISLAAAELGLGQGILVRATEMLVTALSEALHIISAS